MGSYTCPSCNGEGRKQRTVITQDWNGNQVVKQDTEYCSKCSGSGSLERDGSPTYTSREGKRYWED